MGTRSTSPAEVRPGPESAPEPAPSPPASGPETDAAAEVYAQLRALAGRFMTAERASHTLQATALAHEAFLRLAQQTQSEFRDREHYLALAAAMIRRVLVDHARRRAAAKRGSGFRRIELTDAAAVYAGGGVDLVALDEALEELGRLNARHRRVVELRFFGGLGVADCARVLEVSAATVKADWRLARAWLRRRLEPEA